MTITIAHQDRAYEAVQAATRNVNMRTMALINAWLAKNTGFQTLTELVTHTVAHGYTPTLRATAESAKAVREVALVEAAFNACCTWAFGAGTDKRAYCPDALGKGAFHRCLKVEA